MIQILKEASKSCTENQPLRDKIKEKVFSKDEFKVINTLIAKKILEKIRDQLLLELNIKPEDIFIKVNHSY